MDCYVFTRGSVFKGIRLEYDPLWRGLVLTLGEKGPGGNYESIPVSRKNSPKILKNLVYEAHHEQKVVGLSKKGKQFLTTLARHRPADQRILVRIDTRWCFRPGSQGGWSTARGKTTDLVVVFGAHSEDGQHSSWKDGLVIMCPGDVLKIELEGGSQDEAYALIYDGTTLTCQRFRDWEQPQTTDGYDEVEEA